MAADAAELLALVLESAFGFGRSALAATAGPEELADALREKSGDAEPAGFELVHLVGGPGVADCAVNVAAVLATSGRAAETLLVVDGPFDIATFDSVAVKASIAVASSPGPDAALSFLLAELLWNRALGQSAQDVSLVSLLEDLQTAGACSLRAPPSAPLFPLQRAARNPEEPTTKFLMELFGGQFQVELHFASGATCPAEDERLTARRVLREAKAQSADRRGDKLVRIDFRASTPVQKHPEQWIVTERPLWRAPALLAAGFAIASVSSFTIDLGRGPGDPLATRFSTNVLPKYPSGITCDLRTFMLVAGYPAPPLPCDDAPPMPPSESPRGRLRELFATKEELQRAGIALLARKAELKERVGDLEGRIWMRTNAALVAAGMEPIREPRLPFEEGRVMRVDEVREARGTFGAIRECLARDPAGHAREPEELVAERDRLAAEAAELSAVLAPIEDRKMAVEGSVMELARRIAASEGGGRVPDEIA
ncbi:hypothetical protein DFJ74DRAFT_703420 [Hyaloraphidium curvatum]|nr:hypothetical protein DFJ74DRAFT_703420 [Hyaloraphidium curvatum]